ncbi:MAG TPA: GNAT family N-acetyltransferase [Sphingomicrobium sp.]|jgi:RimJ/RimL family protein N-acetyltransferase|nr:GNAT family N-acetyltransferase [Sphingomicrobium sp.]
MIAETDRLVLRKWGEGDSDRFHAIMNRPAVMRWLGGVQGPEEWSAAYERIIGYQRDFGFTFWIVERKADGEMLGFCGLKRANAPGADAIAGDVEIGWRLREEAWGQGYAKEAAIASLDLAFDRFRAPFVIAMTALGNLPSQGLMKRLGMIRRADLDFVHQAFPADSDVNPQIIFRIDAADWPAARAAAIA